MTKARRRLEGGEALHQTALYIPGRVSLVLFWFSRAHWIAGAIADWDGPMMYTFGSLQQKSSLHVGENITYATRCQILSDPQAIPHYLFNPFLYVSSNLSRSSSSFYALPYPPLSPIETSAGILGEGDAIVEKRVWRSLNTSKVTTLRSTRNFNHSSHLIPYMCANNRAQGILISVPPRTRTSLNKNHPSLSLCRNDVFIRTENLRHQSACCCMCEGRL